jgi:hypothetical protein
VGRAALCGETRLRGRILLQSRSMAFVRRLRVLSRLGFQSWRSLSALQAAIVVALQAARYVDCVVPSPPSTRLPWLTVS